MGLYLTAYAKCRKQIKTTTKDRMVCQTKGCSNNKKDVYSPFCPLCGNPISKISIPVVGYNVNPCDVTKNERLFNVPVGSDHFDYYLPNVHVKEEPSLNTDAKRSDEREAMEAAFSESVILEISPQAPLKHIEFFKKAFAADIQVLNNAYGAENVSIHFGFASCRS